MNRFLVVMYAAIAYLGFLAVMLWAVAFLADVPLLTAVDHGTRGSTSTAVLVDLALLGAFAVQHSAMARDRVKQAMRRVVPVAAERATYVLATDVVLILLLWQWRPVDVTVWDVHGQPWRDLLWLLCAIGWVTAVSATFMIDHLDFVGLRQAATGTGSTGPFVERWLYAWVRHPLLLGVLIAFWATPELSAGHALFAGAATGYILVGMRLEERDLRRHLGEPYREYAARTPALVPRPRRREPVRDPSSVVV